MSGNLKMAKAIGNKGLSMTLGGYKRVDIYDWLRLIATIFVVIGHSAYLNISTTYGGVAYELSEQVNPLYNSHLLSWLRWMSHWVYGFHMPLFFMLSGAVLGLKSIPDFDSLFRSKVKRLLFPYFVWGWGFMFPVKRLGGFYDNQSVFQAMSGFLKGEDSGHLWFLTALFWCMIIFCIIYKCFYRFGITSGYIILLCSGIIQLVGATYFPFDILGLKTGLSYIFYFALGYQFENERSTHEKWNIRTTIFSFIVIWCIEYLNYHFELGILNKFFIIVTGSFFTYLLADICSRVFVDVSNNRLWRITIKNLFYIYIFHDPLEYLVLRVTMHYRLLSSAIGCVVYVVMRTVMVFLIGVFFGELVRMGKEYVGRLMIPSIKHNE